MFGNLPQELQINILLKLPLKLLIRSRCVSKSWNSLISSPYFTSLQTQLAMISRAKSIKERDPTILRTICYSTSQNSNVFSVHVDDGQFTLLEDIEIEEYPFQDKIRYYNRIVCACNGAFCLSDDLLSSVALWNPVIKRIVVLPWSRANIESFSFALGFGFDARNYDYKVVKIAFARKGDVVVPPEAEVYALSTGSWRKINGNIPRNCIMEHLWPQVFVHRNVHWTAYRKIGDQVENLIVVFDVEHEVFGEMPLPDALKNEAPLRLNVTAFEQSLAVVHGHGHGPGLKSFSIWVMKNYGDKESWNKLCIAHPCNVVGILRTYGCRVSGGMVFSSRVGDFNAYHITTWWRVMSCETLKRIDTGPYVESLALLSEVSEARVSMESEADECECDESLSSSTDDGFRAQVRTVRYIEFWMLSHAI